MYNESNENRYYLILEEKYQLQAQNRIIQVADSIILQLTNETCFNIRYVGKKWNINKILLLIDKMKYQCIKQLVFLSSTYYYNNL